MWKWLKKDFPFEGKPSFETRGAYFLVIWDQPPLATTEWTLFRWKQLIDLMHDLNLNLFEIFLWPRDELGKVHNFSYGEDEETQTEATQARVELYKQVFAYAKEKGMETGIGWGGNVATRSIVEANPELWGTVGGWWVGQYLCWSKPKTRDILLDLYRKQVETYDVDGYWIVPRDPGGCNCEKCTPYWKSLSEQINAYAEMVHSIKPNAKFSYVTWTSSSEEIEHVVDAISPSVGVRLHTLSHQPNGRDAEEFRRLMRYSLDKGHQTEAWVELDMESYQPFPSPYAQKVKRYLQITKEEGGAGAVSFVITPPTKIANLYTYARLLWNPSLEVHALYEEFAERFIGKENASEVASFLSLLDKSWRVGGKERVQLLEKLVEISQFLLPATELGRRNFDLFTDSVQIRLSLEKASLAALIAREAFQKGEESKAKEAWQEESQMLEDACREAFTARRYSVILTHFNKLEAKLMESQEKPPWERK